MIILSKKEKGMIRDDLIKWLVRYDSMEKKPMVTDTVDELIGIILAEKRPIQHIGIYAKDRGELIKHIRERPEKLPLGVVLPCGEAVVFTAEEDIPKESMPCRCGRRSHWFVRYSSGGKKERKERRQGLCQGKKGGEQGLCQVKGGGLRGTDVQS